MDERRSARVFLGVAIAPHVARAVAELCQAIGRHAPAGLFRFVDPEHAHVTLRFLAQRTPEEQDAIARAATAAASDTATFSLGFGALGVFPDERRPHTLWMGIADGRAEMVALAARLTERLAEAGFLPEERPYVPHLTLARVKFRPPADLRKKILGAEAARTEPQIVESFSLFESRPAGGAVRYVPLRTFPLEKPCTPSK